MLSLETSQARQDFQKWREQLTLALPRRKEALIDLIDALSSNQQATSVAELSLNPLFARDYNSLYKGIAEFLPPANEANYFPQLQQIFQAACQSIPAPHSRSFN